MSERRGQCLGCAGSPDLCLTLLSLTLTSRLQVTCLSAEGGVSAVEVALTSSGQRATDQLVAGGLAERPPAARAVQQSSE